MRSLPRAEKAYQKREAQFVALSHPGARLEAVKLLLGLISIFLTLPPL